MFFNIALYFLCPPYTKKKKGIYHRHPIFINLKSNTMKNTVQIYDFYVIQHNNYKLKLYF